MNLIELVLRLLGRTRTIESVTAAASKVVRDLDSLEKVYTAKAATAAKKAAAAAAIAERNRQEASDAKELATNWKNSGLVRPSRKAA